MTMLVNFLIIITVILGIIVVWMYIANRVSSKKAEFDTVSKDLVVQFVNESQVAADRLTAVVEEVDGSIKRLTDITNLSTAQEQELRERSRHTRDTIEYTFSAMQEVASSAEHIRSSSSDMANESEQTKDLILDVCRSLTATDRIM